MRDSDKGALIASQYARIRLVYGTLDDSDLLEAEAKRADIVLSEYPVYNLVAMVEDALLIIDLTQTGRARIMKTASERSRRVLQPIRLLPPVT